MRLLHTSAWKLEDFVGKNIPKYAILSHTWEEGEVTFQDLQQGFPTEEEPKKGWSKLQGCRAQAVQDGFKWVWIDTCCIDKSSSAELSEAINSMFNWYREAEVCYAYLADVSTGSNLYQENGPFRCSKWFTRGWTLQELLAPGNLVFFNQQWEGIETRKKLEYLVSEITGIENLQGFEGACIAQKMSWASKRETTRVEDMAYSLMGIFGVNMPPLYGEGSKAFLRLQKEILSNSDDETIFAWQDPGELSGGLLAQSPAAFRLSGNILRRDFDLTQPNYMMTNKGLRIEAFLECTEDPTSLFLTNVDTCMFPLKCWRPSIRATLLGVLLRRIQGNRYARICPDKLAEVSTGREVELRNPKSRTIFYVMQQGHSEPLFRGPYEFRISILTDSLHSFAITARYRSNEPRSKWTSSLRQETLMVDKLTGIGNVAGLLYKNSNGDNFMVYIRIFADLVTADALVLKDNLSFQGVMENITRLPSVPLDGWRYVYHKPIPGEVMSAELAKEETSTELQRYHVHIINQKDGFKLIF